MIYPAGDAFTFNHPSNAQNWLGSLVEVWEDCNRELIGAGRFLGWRFNPDLPTVIPRHEPPPWVFALVFEGWELRLQHHQMVHGIRFVSLDS